MSSATRSTTSKSSPAVVPSTKLNNNNMAAAKNPLPTADTPTSTSKSSKMHRRSRSGCFTCRLRRKKCEEGRPSCRACKHLGLRCEYKRPMWWGNGEQRRQQKEMIKNVIKQTQLSKKSAAQVQQQQQQQQQQQSGTITPPSLCHSLPTTADYFSDSMPQTRAPSVDSPFSGGFDVAHLSPDGFYAMPPPPQPLLSSHGPYPMFSPYEVDIKTERQIFVNDVPTRRDSTISTFSTYQPQTLAEGFPADSWVQQEYHDSLHEEFAEEPVDFDFFEFPHGSISPTHETVIAVDECDQYLLSHFFDKVLKLIFPILDANQHGSARSDVILPALESNTAYLHCCLSIAATHMKATEPSPASSSAEQLDHDIVRHRYAAVTELCAALGRDTDHAGILEATLGMIFFQCSVGRADDALPDIAWHQHFQAATSLIQKLALPSSLTALPAPPPAFNMTLAAWIDILGSNMLGRSPTFADTYRDLLMRNGSAGLAELMGCDDKVMFLISEVACLEAQKLDGLDEVLLCKYVQIMAHEIAETERVAPPVSSCFSSSSSSSSSSISALRPRQLSINLTAVFRVAARIFLVALVPGFEPRQPSMCHLMTQFADLMEFVPAGPDGFDRSLVWPLLIAGAASIAGDAFRSMFAERCARLGDAADFGSFGRVRGLLADVWEINDAAAARGEYAGVHWREVMREKEWDFLLI